MFALILVTVALTGVTPLSGPLVDEAQDLIVYGRRDASCPAPEHQCSETQMGAYSVRALKRGRAAWTNPEFAYVAGRTEDAVIVLSRTLERAALLELGTGKVIFACEMATLSRSDLIFGQTWSSEGALIIVPSSTKRGGDGPAFIPTRRLWLGEGGCTLEVVDGFNPLKAQATPGAQSTEVSERKRKGYRELRHRVKIGKNWRRFTVDRFRLCRRKVSCPPRP